MDLWENVTVDVLRFVTATNKKYVYVIQLIFQAMFVRALIWIL